MRTLVLILAAAAGLGGCVYDPYYGYAYYPPDAAVAGAIVGGAVGAVVVTDPDLWPYRHGGYYYRYPYAGYWHGRPYPYRPYPRGGYWRH